MHHAKKVRLNEEEDVFCWNVPCHVLLVCEFALRWTGNLGSFGSLVCHGCCLYFPDDGRQRAKASRIAQVFDNHSHFIICMLLLEPLTCVSDACLQWKSQQSTRPPTWISSACSLCSGVGCPRACPLLPCPNTQQIFVSTFCPQIWLRDPRLVFLPTSDGHCEPVNMR